jgi:hypothetical protein
MAHGGQGIRVLRPGLCIKIMSFAPRIANGRADRLVISDDRGWETQSCLGITKHVTAPGAYKLVHSNGNIL